MTQIDPKDNERKAASAFSRQSVIFDQIYGNDPIIQYKRKRVRDHVNRYLIPNGTMLELNSGTGEDAIYFAGKGVHVHTTDLSEGMLSVQRKKIKEIGLESMISSEQCSFTELENLNNTGPFDYIFSNFAGLNCTDRLDHVLQSFHPLLKKEGVITLVILPKFCLWESSLFVKGKWKTAFRRWSGKSGAKSHIEGEYFNCWYYNPTYVQKQLGEKYELLSLEGLCTLVPPSYMQGFTVNYPNIYQRLIRLEDKWKSVWPFRSMGDYYIISFRKK